VPLVAVRSAKFEPSEIPEIVEFCSWLLPMVVVETTKPLALTESRVSFLPERVS
jgi:hypothetical protein